MATNIAGRGTDITTSNEVEEHGGLHVIITFLPNNSRVECQNAGRTARQGKKGSCQLIILDEEGGSMEELKENRSQNEKKSIEAALEDLNTITLKDTLFTKYCALQRELIPNLQDEQKIKDWHDMITSWSKEERRLTPKVLEEKFLQHCEEIKKKHSKHEQTILKSLDTELREEWIFKYKKQYRENFCSKWEGKVSSDVMSAFREEIQYIRNQNQSGHHFSHFSNGVFEQRGLAEQWAIWLHINLSDKNLNPEDFSAFEEKMRMSTKTKALIENPAYFIQKGNNYLTQSDFDLAIDCFKFALGKDKEFSLLAHVNLALAHVSFKENKGFHQEEAIAHLELGLNNLDSAHKPSLLQLNTLVGRAGGGKETSEHVKYQMDVLGEIENHCCQALKIINEAHKNGNHVKVSKVSLSELFSDDDNKNHAHAIREIEMNGLACLFTVQEKFPTPWWSIIGITLLGIAQIAAGAFLTAWTGGSLGKGLIAEGISDLIVAVKAAITLHRDFQLGCLCNSKGNKFSHINNFFRLGINQKRFSNNQRNWKCHRQVYL